MVHPSRETPLVHPVYYPLDTGAPLLNESGASTLPAGMKAWACPGLLVKGGTTIQLTPDSPVQKRSLRIHMRNSGGAHAETCYARAQICAPSTMPEPLHTLFDKRIAVREDDTILRLAPGEEDWWETSLTFKGQHVGHRCLLVTTWGSPGDPPLLSGLDLRPSVFEDRHVAQLNLNILGAASSHADFSTPTDFPPLPPRPSSRAPYAFWARNGLRERGTFRVLLRSNDALGRSLLSRSVLRVHDGDGWGDPKPATRGALIGLVAGEQRGCVLHYPTGSSASVSASPVFVDVEQTLVRPGEDLTVGGISLVFKRPGG